MPAWTSQQVIILLMEKGEIQWCASPAHHPVLLVRPEFSIFPLCCFKTISFFLTHAGFLILLRLAYLSNPILPSLITIPKRTFSKAAKGKIWWLKNKYKSIKMNTTNKMTMERIAIITIYNCKGCRMRMLYVVSTS